MISGRAYEIVLSDGSLDQDTICFWEFAMIMIMIVIMIVIRVEAEKHVHPFNYIQ